MEKAPAFQFYPKDFLADSNVVCMSLQERGAYITLLCRCWLDASLPADEDRLARLCGVPVAAFRRFWPAVGVCFRPHPELADRIIHPRLELEREKQEGYRRRQSDRGRASGESRRREPETNLGSTSVRTKTNLGSTGAHEKTNLGSILDEPETNLGSTGLGSTGVQRAPVEPETNSSISDLPSPDYRQREHARARDPAPGDDEEVTERAARFLERYGALHVKYRNGATYLGRSAVDFQEALLLCRAYDDTRLDKLAIVFLNADDEFSASGTRTVAKFRSRASWCDERLRAKGM